MLPTPVSAALGFVFVLVGGAAVWLIFAASTRMRDQSARDRIIRAHRIAGYLFIALFCLMSWFMLLRLGETSDELSLRSMLAEAPRQNALPGQTFLFSYDSTLCRRSNTNYLWRRDNIPGYFRWDAAPEVRKCKPLYRCLFEGIEAGANKY